ncbi:MAG: chemotaxis protein CheW [Terriglobia bacterium]|jgi:chemotaxis protein histidine kinase CheA
MGDMDDIVREFLVESNENLDQLDRDLVTLEKDPTARDILASIFRTIHTIKGTTGFLGFSRLESVAHVGENLLSNLRDGRLLLDAEITSALLAMVDAVRQMLVNIENTGQDGQGDYTHLIELLTRLQGGEKKKKEPAPAMAAPPPPPTVPRSSLSGPPPAPSNSTETNGKSEVPSAVGLPLGEMLIQAGRANPEEVNEALKLQQNGDDRRLGEILVDKGATPPAAVQEALQVQTEARASALSDSNIRVDVSLLDKLMNLVGELVLARNQILQFSSSQQDTTFLNTTQRLNLITTELQEGVMKTRMQPIGNIWSKFPRVVRDLAASCGKQIRLEMEGKETELDKTLIEAIKDPLTHVVRNAVDHGVEIPEKRAAAGKPAEGRLFLRAFHEGGQVNIEISDDGAGIDLERVKQKALAKSLITPDQASRMNDRELSNLIFLPGLSTAEKVTNVSGRGVGMDVVKTNIEKIGGTVDIQSRLGNGTTLKIKIPLTLAIIPALIVTSGGDRYAIPQVSLLELVRLEGEQARKGIEMIHGAPVYRLRGKLLPLAYLNQQLCVEKSGDGSNRPTREGQVTHSPAGAETDNRDFASARSKHQLCKSMLRDFLDGRGTITAAQASSYKDCPLGKWLYSSGLEEFGGVPEVQRLDNLHQRLHEVVCEIIASMAPGDTVRSEKELARVESLSGQIVSLLPFLEQQTAAGSATKIVVLQADDHHFGLVVDEINDTEEIVVKPLGKQLKGIATFAGATIMGDGQVALILDVLGLAQRANVVSEVRDRGVGEKAAETGAHLDDGESLLLLRGPDDGRMAMPLSLVARLEEFTRSSLETAEGRDVVQYRGQILPLIHLSSALPERREQARRSDSSEPEAENEKIQVVVYSNQGRSVGLVVDRILDITHERVKIQMHAARQGTLGSMVVQGRVTELLDLKGIIQTADPSFFEESTAA